MQRATNEHTHTQCFWLTKKRETCFSRGNKSIVPPVQKKVSKCLNERLGPRQSIRVGSLSGEFFFFLSSVFTHMVWASLHLGFRVETPVCRNLVPLVCVHLPPRSRKFLYSLFFLRVCVHSSKKCARARVGERKANSEQDLKKQLPHHQLTASQHRIRTIRAGSKE